MLFRSVAAAATNIAGKGFTANWNTSNTATSYYLDVATDAGFLNKVVDNQNVTNVITFDVGSLSGTTQYFYRVRAYNANGTSENSNTVSLTTALALNPTSNILYVSTLGSGNKDGSSWANALDGAGFYNNVSKLNFAISNVSGPTQIWVASGTYLPTNISNRRISFNLAEGIKLYGGFASTETALAQRKLKTNVSILSGDIGIVGNNSDNSYHVVYNDNSDVALTLATTLDGFTIQGGNANGSGNYANGGGIMLKWCSPEIAHCKIINNNAKADGGGMQILGSDSRFINCTFSGNSAENAAAIDNSNGTPVFINCLISGNYASTGASGIKNSSFDTNPQFINCTIT